MSRVEDQTPLSDFERAWLEALAREEDKTAESGSVAKPSRGGGNGHRAPVVRKPVVSYRRSILRATLDERVGTFEEDVPVVRKRTIHVVPQRVQVAEQERKALEGKLIYQAGKIGSAWSKWINEAKPGGWRHIDPKLTGEWVSFMERVADFDTERRAAILATVGVGMNLDSEYITSGTSTSDNKISYMINAASTRRHLLIGMDKVPIGSGRLNSGAFFLVSVGHLSALEPSSELITALRDSLAEQHSKSNGQFFGRQGTYAGVSDWAGKPPAREYFAKRSK